MSVSMRCPSCDTYVHVGDRECWLCHDRLPGPELETVELSFDAPPAPPEAAAAAPPTTPPPGAAAPPTTPPPGAAAPPTTPPPGAAAPPTTPPPGAAAPLTTPPPAAPAPPVAQPARDSSMVIKAPRPPAAPDPAAAAATRVLKRDTVSRQSMILLIVIIVVAVGAAAIFALSMLGGGGSGPASQAGQTSTAAAMVASLDDIPVNWSVEVRRASQGPAPQFDLLGQIRHCQTPAEAKLVGANGDHTSVTYNDEIGTNSLVSDVTVQADRAHAQAFMRVAGGTCYPAAVGEIVAGPRGEAALAVSPLALSEAR